MSFDTLLLANCFSLCPVLLNLSVFIRSILHILQLRMERRGEDREWLLARWAGLASLRRRGTPFALAWLHGFCNELELDQLHARREARRGASERPRRDEAARGSSIGMIIAK